MIISNFSENSQQKNTEAHVLCISYYLNLTASIVMS